MNKDFPADKDYLISKLKEIEKGSTVFFHYYNSHTFPYEIVKLEIEEFCELFSGSGVSTMSALGELAIQFKHEFTTKDEERKRLKTNLDNLFRWTTVENKEVSLFCFSVSEREGQPLSDVYFLLRSIEGVFVGLKTKFCFVTDY